MRTLTVWSHALRLGSAAADGLNAHYPGLQRVARLYRRLEECRGTAFRAVQDLINPVSCTSHKAALRRQESQVGFRLFISYRRDDSQGHARALCRYLDERFVTGAIFFDRNRDAIAEGSEFLKRIEQALNEIQIMLVLIGKSWISARDEQNRLRLHLPDDIVRFELETALKHGRKVIPVLLEGCSPVKATDLPDSLADLAGLDAFMLGGKTEEYWRGCERLAELINQAPGMADIGSRYSAKAPHARRLREMQSHYLGQGRDRRAFVGRDVQLWALDDWLSDAEGPANLLLVGASAMGKTSLVLNWLQNIQGDRQGHAIVYLPISVRFGTNTPEMFWSMAAARLGQLAGLAFEVPENRLAETCLDISLDALDLLRERDQHLLLVIDGLDEAAGWEVDHRLLSDQRPGVRCVVSARAVGTESAAVDRWLQVLGWRRGRRTEVMELQPLGRDAVLVAVEAFATGRGRLPDADAFALGTQIWRLSSGDPLLLGYFLDDLAQAWRNPDVDALQTLRESQPGFANYFAHWARLQKPYWSAAEGRTDQLDGLLALLACAHGPIGTADLEVLLSRAFGVMTPLSTSRLHALQRFIVEVADGWTLDHPRLQAHLLEEFSAEGGWITRARKAFVDWGREACRASTDSIPSGRGSRYLARYLAQHLVACNAAATDMVLLAGAPWARLSLFEDDSGRQLALDLLIARREVTARAIRTDPKLAWRWSIFLMHTSVVSRALVPAELLVAYVQNNLVKRSHAIRRLELMPPKERSIGLALLSVDVLPDERDRLLDEALASVRLIQDFEHRTWAWAQILRMMPASFQRLEEEKILLHSLNDAGSMYYQLVAFRWVAPILSTEAQRSLLEWVFQTVKAPRYWPYIDGVMCCLRSELSDEAIWLATDLTNRLNTLPAGSRGSDRTSFIDDEALPYLFRALNEDEARGCWERVYTTLQRSVDGSTLVDCLAWLLPWLREAGRESEVLDQLKGFDREYDTLSVKAESLARFARDAPPGKVADLALALALDASLEIAGDHWARTNCLQLLAPLIDDASVELCFQSAMRKPANERLRALAPVAFRLSPVQLQAARNMRLPVGDQVDALAALCALNFHDATDAHGSRFIGALDGLRALCPEGPPDYLPARLFESANPERWERRFGAHLQWLAKGDDTLLIARLNGGDPTALWAAIQRKSNSGERARALLKHLPLLQGVAPTEEVIHAVRLLIGDKEYAGALDAIDGLADEIAVPLRESLESAIAGADTGWIPVVEGACLLAARLTDSGRARWHQLALDTARDKTRGDPEVDIALLPLCSEAERPAHLEMLRRHCESSFRLGFDALVRLMHLLKPHETADFILPWLDTARRKCQEEPDWLAVHGPMPEPFATVTLEAIEDLLQAAPRASILRFIATWARPIAQTQGQSGVHALIAGVRAATEVFE